MPAFIFHKRVIRAQIHAHRFSAVWAVRHQFGWDPHAQVSVLRRNKASVFQDLIPLGKQHLSNDFFIVILFLAARLRALKQAVISLRVKQTVFIKSGFLEAVVYICGDDKIALIFHQAEQFLVNRFWRVLITVDVNVSAPVRPVFFQRIIRVEAARIHIVETVFLFKICKIFPEPLTAVGKSGRCRKPSPGSY